MSKKNETLRSRVVLESTLIALPETVTSAQLRQMYPDVYWFYQNPKHWDRRVQVISNGEGGFVLVPGFEDKLTSLASGMGGIEQLKKAFKKIEYSKVQAGILLACAMYTESEYLEPMVVHEIYAFLYQLGLQFSSETMYQELAKLQRDGWLLSVKEVHSIAPLGDTFKVLVQPGYFTDATLEEIWGRDSEKTHTDSDDANQDSVNNELETSLSE